jgi:hypothetical protein
MTENGVWFGSSICYICMCIRISYEISSISWLSFLL